MTGVERVPREDLDVSRRELLAGTSAVAGAAVTGAVPREVAAQADPDNEISGTVTDSNGAVQGATVVAVPHDASLDPLVTATDSSGDYQFSESDLYFGDELYHVIARDGTESDPRRGQQNYPFLAAAGGGGTVDNFESVLYEDVSRTLSSYYDGDTSSASRVNDSSVAIEGDYYLQLQTGGSDNTISSVPGTALTDLNAYPSEGDTFRVWLFPGSEDAGVYWARQSENSSRESDGYSARIGGSRDEFNLERDGMFGGTTLDSSSLSISDSAWYEIEVGWGVGGSITATLYDEDGNQVSQLSANDSTYSGGGISFVANNNNLNSNTRFDNFRITS